MIVQYVYETPGDAPASHARSERSPGLGNVSPAHRSLAHVCDYSADLLPLALEAVLLKANVDC